MDVLICDDDADLRMLLQMNVLALGHTPRLATDGVEALAACHERIPDVLLLDVAMPGHDGPTLLSELRAAGIAPARTILVSATHPDHLRRLAATLDVGWINKPFTIDHVRTAFGPDADGQPSSASRSAAVSAR